MKQPKRLPKENFRDMQSAESLIKKLKELDKFPDALGDKGKQVLIVGDYDENGFAKIYGIKRAYITVRGDEYVFVIEKGKSCGNYSIKNIEYVQE